MTKKRGKSVSFDAMVKFFMQQYDIPTRKDIDRLIDRIDRLEKRIAPPGDGRSRTGTVRTDRSSGGADGFSAADTVLKVVQQSAGGMSIHEIQEKTGFEDKKLRNIIFRLNKNGKIRRLNRGFYISV
jgi:hypothetical protein